MKTSAKLLLTLNRGVSFSLDAYLATLSTSFRFNTRHTDRFFQESIGPTLADDVGETIGLALDQASWGGRTFAGQLETAANVLAGLDFTSGWTPGGSATIVDSNTFSCTANSGVTKDVGIEIGARYYCEVTYTKSDASTAFIVYNSNVGSGTAMMLTQTAASGTARLFFVATSTSVFFRLNGTVSVDVTSITVRKVPGFAGIQTGASTLRPTRQVEGAKFDGGDDNWLMTYLAAAGSNFIQARTTVPASLAAAQVIAGASGAAANRIFVGVNTSGFACGGVGSDSTTTIVGTSDLRSTEADIALTCNGSTVRLIVNGAVEYEAAQNSTPTTSIPYRIGALNNNGTGGSYYGGAIRDISGGTDFLTVERFNQIRAAVAANQ